jgi:hypothetical protein
VKYVLICLIFYSSLIAQNKKWGWATHEYINDHAVGYLPTEMSFFQDHRNFIKNHSTDPDVDGLPGYYHYIDIDYYPEFFSDTFPTNMDSLIALYDLSIVEKNGTIPWIIEKWTDSLSTLMANGQWDDVWQIAAELGHYVADSHQPLHLTTNYNGQFTGNDGIHSRYETFMINQHLFQLPLSQERGIYWQSVIDSVFLYIGEVYPYVDRILSADDLATIEDPNYGTEYYDIMWQELEKLTTKSIHMAITDLASLWRTAWENAGGPLPLSIPSNDHDLKIYYLANNYPNPFNPKTVISYQLPEFSNVELTIYNALGEQVAILVSNIQSAGKHTIEWDASGYASGVYIYKIQAGEFQDVKKMILLR